MITVNTCNRCHNNLCCVFRWRFSVQILMLRLVSDSSCQPEASVFYFLGIRLNNQLSFFKEGTFCCSKKSWMIRTKKTQTCFWKSLSRSRSNDVFGVWFLSLNIVGNIWERSSRFLDLNKKCVNAFNVVAYCKNFWERVLKWGRKSANKTKGNLVSILLSGN